MRNPSASTISGMLTSLLFLTIGIIHAESINVTTLYSTPINPLNAVHPLWTPVQHYRGKTFVVVPDVNLRPMVTEIDSDGKTTTVPLDPDPDYLASTDGHNRFTMGIDKDGYLHIAGDMHGYAWWASTYVARYQYQNILYWKSNKSLDVTGGFTFAGGLNSASALPGEEWGGDSRFFNDRNGELYFSSRVRAFTGGPLAGSEPFIAYGMYRYDAATGLWTAIGGSAESGAPGAKNYNKVLYWEWTMSFEAYQNAPRFDSKNRLHFAIAGNTGGTKGQGLIYACSDDGGNTWKKASGAAIPGLPLRGKDGEPNQGDLIIRSPKVAQQSPLYIDKDGKVAVHGDNTWYTWNGTAWVPISGGMGILGPDNMMTAETGSTLSRSAALGQPSIAYDTGFGQVFSISELGLQTDGSIYAIGLPPGTNFVNATRMSVFKATFTSDGSVATGGTPSASSSSPQAAQAFDGNINSKWYTGTSAPGWLQYAFAPGVKRTVFRYDVTSGNDMPGRDPKDWQFQGSIDGATWVTLDTRTGEVFQNRCQTKHYPISNNTEYAFYRLNITATASANQGLQLSELALIGVDNAHLLAAPRIFFAQGENTKVWLSWTASAGATGYNVKRATNKGGPYTTIAKGVTKTGEFTDTECKNDTTYQYVVSALNSAGESPDSEPVSVMPHRQKPRPPLIQTAIGHNARITLNWLPLWPDAATYNIKRATAKGGPYSTVATGITGLSYTDTGLINDTPYFYVVSAANPIDGESANSNEATAAPFRWVKILKYKSVGKNDAGTASASAENPPHEAASRAFDGGMNTKWLMPAATGWLQYRFADGEKWAVTRYRVISGRDAPERDPRDWQFQASEDGKTWITLDTQTNQVFDKRNAILAYSFTNSTAYQYYRLNITRNAGNGLTQLAELELWADDVVLPAR